MKTLKELSEIAGFPFDAVNCGCHFHFIGISPNDQIALGWDRQGDARRFSALLPNWTLEPKKKVLKSFVYKDSWNNVFHAGMYLESPELWCKNAECELIKILDEVEV